jgi:serine/threonine protein kinase
MSIDIIHLASELGIGPKLYDYFISEDEFNQCTLVKVYEFIDGDTWFHSTWPTKSDYQTKVAELKDLIKRMNAAGIIHNDLHLNNVMINKAGRVYIIDYDRAVFATEYESLKMEEKLETSDVNKLGVFDAKCIRFLYLSQGLVSCTAIGWLMSLRAMLCNSGCMVVSYITRSRSNAPPVSVGSLVVTANLVSKSKLAIK